MRAKSIAAVALAATIVMSVSSTTALSVVAGATTTTSVSDSASVATIPSTVYMTVYSSGYTPRYENASAVIATASEMLANVDASTLGLAAPSFDSLSLTIGSTQYDYLLQSNAEDDAVVLTFNSLTNIENAIDTITAAEQAVMDAALLPYVNYVNSLISSGAYTTTSSSDSAAVKTAKVSNAAILSAVAESLSYTYSETDLFAGDITGGSKTYQVGYLSTSTSGSSSSQSSVSNDGEFDEFPRLILDGVTTDWSDVHHLNILNNTNTSWWYAVDDGNAANGDYYWLKGMMTPDLGTLSYDVYAGTAWIQYGSTVSSTSSDSNSDTDVALTSITAAISASSLYEGDVATIDVAKSPSNATDTLTYTYTPDSAAVSITSAGVVTANAVDEDTPVVITVTATNEDDVSFTSTVNLTVKAPAQSDDGTVYLTGITAAVKDTSLDEGDSTTITVTQNPSTATESVSYTYTTESDAVEISSDGTVTANEVDEDTAVTITVTATTENGNTFTASTALIVRDTASSSSSTTESTYWSTYGYYYNAAYNYTSSYVYGISNGTNTYYYPNIEYASAAVSDNSDYSIVSVTASTHNTYELYFCFLTGGYYYSSVYSPYPAFTTYMTNATAVNTSNYYIYNGYVYTTSGAVVGTVASRGCTSSTLWFSTYDGLFYTYAQNGMSGYYVSSYDVGDYSSYYWLNDDDDDEDDDVSTDVSDITDSTSTTSSDSASSTTATVSYVTSVSADKLASLKSANGSYVFKANGSASWCIDGSSITDTSKAVSFKVVYGNKSIPDALTSAVKKGAYSAATLTIGDNVSWGLSADLTLKFSTQRAGYTAKIYHYDTSNGTLNLVDSSTIGSNGYVSFEDISAGGEYIVVLSK